MLKQAFKDGLAVDIHLVCEELKRINQLDAVEGIPYVVTPGAVFWY